MRVGLLKVSGCCLDAKLSNEIRNWPAQCYRSVGMLYGMEFLLWKYISSVSLLKYGYQNSCSQLLHSIILPWVRTGQNLQHFQLTSTRSERAYSQEDHHTGLALKDAGELCGNIHRKERSWSASCRNKSDLRASTFILTSRSAHWT
jgi:hypothetical protein